MKTIFLTKFGSEIYGTSTPTSDTDIKGIFIPNSKDIILQQVQNSITKTTKINKSFRNTSEDIDTEYFSLQKYMELLLDGQTVSLDMLFCPQEFWLEESEIWYNITQNYEQFLHKGLTAFIGYCRTQASKYGIKGTRVAAVRKILEWLRTFGNNKKLLELPIEEYVNNCENEFIKITQIKNPRGILEPHLEVNGRKIALHCTIKYACDDVLQKIFDNYGARALMAEENMGVDWKALSHAVRVCGQAKELLKDHIITFPRPDAALLLQIKKGELAYKKVAEIIENGMCEVEELTKISTLQSIPNYKLAEEIIYDVYKKEITNKI